MAPITTLVPTIAANWMGSTPMSTIVGSSIGEMITVTLTSSMIIPITIRNRFTIKRITNLFWNVSYFANLDRSGDLSAEDALTVRLENGIDGDPFPYGLEPNRRGLEALTQTAFDQLITTRKYSIEELFPESTLYLVG